MMQICENVKDWREMVREFGRAIKLSAICCGSPMMAIGGYHYETDEHFFQVYCKKCWLGRWFTFRPERFQNENPAVLIAGENFKGEG